MGNTCASASAAAAFAGAATAPEDIALPGRVVFLRHGQSTWNEENRFTGWVDVPLTARGEAEAVEAGRALQEAGFRFDVCFTSVLKRAVKTANLVLETMEQNFVSQVKDYRLNERMYGALAGLNKQETVEKHGLEQVMQWRRSYDIPPPEAEDSHPYSPAKERKYKHLPQEAIPKTESLKLTLERVLPFWTEAIAPEVQAGKTVLVAAHGNSIRAILKHLDAIPESVITEINIPTGVPLLYAFDADMRPRKLEGAAEHLSGRYLLDEASLNAKIAEVANQTAAGSAH